MTDQSLRAALQSVASATSLLVASDYDGTLAEIVEDPTLAMPHRRAMDAFERLSRLPGVHGAIVSGRSCAALHELTGNPQGVLLVGTHGAELPGSPLPETAAVDALDSALRRVAATYAGTTLERKPAGVAFHYRNAEEPEAAATAAREKAKSLATRIIEGKMVIEVLLSDTDKGHAVNHLRQFVQADAVVYLGDDATDEDVFAALGPENVTIKVGPEPTAARFRVADPAGVALALSDLADARPPIATDPAG